MDLKALLLEAKQKVPPVLQVLHCGDETMLDIGGERPWAGTGTSRRAVERPGLRTGPPAPGAVPACLRAVVAWPCRQPSAVAEGGRRWRSPSASGVGGHSPGVARLPLTSSLPLQASGAAPSAAAWAIASPTAPSWRQCRPSKSATSAARTTWPTALWTSSRRSVLPSAPPARALVPFQPGQRPSCPHLSQARRPVLHCCGPFSRHLATGALASSA